MIETHAPRTTDVMAVKSRVSWGPIVAGAMVALTIYMVLSMLGLALGIEVASRRADAPLGAGTAIYMILCLLIAMFFGGWTTSRLAVGETKVEAVLYGLILWGVLFLGMIWLVSIGVRAGFGGMVGMASGAYAVSRDTQSNDNSRGPIDALLRRYDSDLGSETFVADLKKSGLTEEQANKVQTEVKTRLDKVRNDPASLPDMAREVAQKPEVQEAARDAAEAVRHATWWTLLGMIVSMGTVITGSLAGSGEILRLVPIIGVRRIG